MTKKIILLLAAIYNINSFSLISQEAIETPQHFGQFYNNPILNIARNSLDSKVEMSLDNQRNVGGFSGVSTSYFSVFYNPKKEKTQRISMGFIFITIEKETLFSEEEFSFLLPDINKFLKIGI